MKIEIQKKLFDEALDLIETRGRRERPTISEVARLTDTARWTVRAYFDGKRGVPFWWMINFVQCYYPVLRPGAVAKIAKRLADSYSLEGTSRRKRKPRQAKT